MVNFTLLFDLLVSGVGLGALYALVAIGFALIYKVTGVLNFAQGQIALVGAYTVVVVIGYLDFPPFVAIGGAILLGIVMGLVLERVVFRYFIGEPILSIIIVTLALAGILDGGTRLLAGPNFQSYPEALSLDWSVSLPFGASIQGAFAIGVIAAVGVVIVLMLFFKYTVIGQILRASASDQQAAMALGVSINKTIIIAWVLSITITVIGGILYAISQGGAGFAIENVGIIIIAAVVLGGLDSIQGAFIGSIVVGILEQLGSFYLDSIFGGGFGTVFPLVFLLGVIVVKPYGLFGTERIERV